MLLTEPPRERAEPDDAQEDEADDQHAGDDIPPFCGRIGEEREHRASLTDSQPVKSERAFHRLRARGGDRSGPERLRLVRARERTVAE